MYLYPVSLSRLRTCKFPRFNFAGAIRQTIGHNLISVSFPYGAPRSAIYYTLATPADSQLRASKNGSADPWFISTANMIPPPVCRSAANLRYRKLPPRNRLAGGGRGKTFALVRSPFLLFPSSLFSFLRRSLRFDSFSESYIEIYFFPCYSRFFYMQRKKECDIVFRKFFFVNRVFKNLFKSFSNF